jgi:glycine hydroxymethyltransferase
MIDILNNIIDKHDHWRNDCINLIPAENVISPMVKEALKTDMGQRYYFENFYKSKGSISYSYHGTKHISELIKHGEQIAKELFNVTYASLYPVSGHLAVIGAISSLCNKGGTILTYDPMYGGYPGLDNNKMPKYLGFNTEYIPVLKDIPEKIDLDSLGKMINSIHPTAIVLSSAHTIFPFPTAEIKALCGKGCLLIYDASHPLGLIAGKQFQDPLNEGTDIIVGSTQKSFPGPQGGIILTNDFEDQIRNIEHFVIVDNPHFHRIAALTIALLEMKHFGKDYAIQIVKNTKVLGASLLEMGFPIKYKELGFSESHMCKIEIFDDYHKFANTLEDANIIIDTAGRIGTNEMTRLGMKENEMVEIAQFMKRIYFDREDPEKVKKQVIEFRKFFQTVKFCF